VRKHSWATHVRVRLDRRDSNWQLTVEHNGVGFPLSGIRLRKGGLYVVHLEDLVPNAEESPGEVDPSKYRDAIIVPSSKGWEMYCRRCPKPLPNPASVRISAPPEDQEAIDELRKLEFRVREVERELEDREAIDATSKLSERCTPIYSWLVILVTLGLWRLIFYGVSDVAQFR
jgi:hypothetical protein